MSIQSDKKQILEGIGVLRTLTSLPSPNNLLFRFDSLKANKNTNSFLFLIELLISIVGIEILLNVISKLLSQTLDSFQGSIKNSIKNHFSGDLPENSPQNNSLKGGINIPIRSIDIFNNLKTDVNSLEANSTYGSSRSFERFLKLVISNPGQQYGYPTTNSNLFYRYNSSNNTINVKTNSSFNHNQLISNIVNDLILFDKQIIIARVYDLMFGTISNKLNKSGQDLSTENKIISIIEKISENEDSDNFFKFNVDDLDDIELVSENRKNGVMGLDLGCGITNVQYSMENVNNIINNFSSNLSEEQVSNIIGQSSNLITSDSTLSSEDKSSTKNNFFREFLMNLKKSLLISLILSPQIKILYFINDAYRNNGNVTNINIVDDIKSKKNMIKCIISSLDKEINKMLFDILKKEILKIAAGIGRLYAKEAADKARLIAKSLIRLR